jgi:hypothetical protein
MDGNEIQDEVKKRLSFGHSCSLCFRPLYVVACLIQNAKTQTCSLLVCMTCSLHKLVIYLSV